jgi:hypothetical protein
VTIDALIVQAATAAAHENGRDVRTIIAWRHLDAELVVRVRAAHHHVPGQITPARPVLREHHHVRIGRWLSIGGPHDPCDLRLAMSELNFYTRDRLVGADFDGAIFDVDAVDVRGPQEPHGRIGSEVHVAGPDLQLEREVVLHRRTRAASQVDLIGTRRRRGQAKCRSSE